jgi:rubredoxin
MRITMSSVYGIDGVCDVCGTDQQAFAKTLSPQPTYNYDLDCRTSEGDWRCLACGYGWERTILESKNGHLWQETFYYPLDDDGFVNRPGDLTKSMAERKAEHRAKCAARVAAPAGN